MARPNDHDGAGTDATAGTGADTSTGASDDARDRSGLSSDPSDDRDPRDEPEQIANEERRRNTAFVSGVIAIVGAWVALSVLIYDVSGAVVLNNVLVGGVVVLAAGYNYYRQYNDVPLSVGVATLITLLGIWLIVAAALLELLGGFFWNTAASGLLIALLAGYNAYEAREARDVTADQDVTN